MGRFVALVLCVAIASGSGDPVLPGGGRKGFGERRVGARRPPIQPEDMFTSMGKLNVHMEHTRETLAALLPELRELVAVQKERLAAIKRFEINLQYAL